jgi:2-keto-3-deoxy-L-rhamnonate aldolase RhmA
MAGHVSSVRDRLGERRLRGAFVKLPAVEVIEILAAELDFAVVDLEHSQLGEADGLRLVRHAAVLGFPAVVRIPEVDRGLVNRLLEAGAAGIQLSTVVRAADVSALRAAARYAPHGNRSISLSHPGARYGAVGLDDYVRNEAAPLIVAQIETIGTEDPLDEILAAGPDVAFVGVTDITVDAGLDRDRAGARVDEILSAATRAGVATGGFGDDGRFRYAVVSSDVSLLQGALASA